MNKLLLSAALYLTLTAAANAQAHDPRYDSPAPSPTFSGNIDNGANFANSNGAIQTATGNSGGNNQTISCPDGTTSCNLSNQHMGDTTVNADRTNSNSTHVGNSSADTVGGNVTYGDNKLQQSGNTVDQSGNTVQGGHATGGASNSMGNKTDIGIGNESNASSNSGNNHLSNGSSSGGNSLSNGGNKTGDINMGSANSGNGSNNSTSATGGAGGAGGAGGTGGSSNSNATGGFSGGNSLNNGNSGGNSSNANNLGQNSSNTNGNANSNNLGQNSSNANSNGQGQGQSSANNNANGQGQSSDNKNANNVGSSNNVGQGQSSKQGQSSRTSNDGSGNSAVNVDTSDRSTTNNSYVNKTIFIPSVVPTSLPSTVGNGVIATTATMCGPLARVINVPVTGYFFGITGQKKVDMGYTQETVPYVDEAGKPLLYKTYQMPDGSLRYIGHMKIINVVQLNVAASRNLALGGGNGDGSWGQGGGGTSSAMQRLVKYIELTECEMPVETRSIRVIEVEAGRNRG
jgi:hypothetical protein